MGPKARTVKFYSTVSDRSEVVHLISRLFGGDGGPGSGNHGHKGRPGQVGGSAPADGAETAVSKAPSGVVHIKIDPKNQKMVSAPLKNGPKSVSSIKREYNDLNNEYVELNKKLAVAMPIDERNKLEVRLGGLVREIRAMREDLANAGEKVGNIGEVTQTAKEKSDIEKCEADIDAKFKEFDEAEKRGNKLLDEWIIQNVERMHEKDPKKKSALAHKVAELAQEVAKASEDKERARKELRDLEKKRDKLREEAERRQEAKNLPEDPKTSEEFERLVEFKGKEYVAARNEAIDLYDEWWSLVNKKQNTDPSDPQWNELEKQAIEKKKQEKAASERRDNITKEINELKYNWRKLDREKEREEKRKNPGEYTALNNDIEDIVDKLSKSDRKVRDLNNEITRIKNELGGNIPQERRDELAKKLALAQDELKSARTHQDYNEADMDVALENLRGYAANNFTGDEIGDRLHEKANEADGYYRDYEYLSDKIGDVNKTIQALLVDGEEEEADRLIKEELEPLVKAQDDVNCRINQIESVKETLRSAYKDSLKREAEEEAKKYGGEAEMYRVKALEHFGTTDNYYESGWILPDGQMLDYSDGMHDGERHHDHREIGEVFPEGSYSRDAMIRFRKHGNIRLYPEVPGINLQLGNDMSEDQEQRIRDIIDEINNEGREMFVVDFSDEYGHMRQFGYAISDGDAWGDHVQIHNGEIDADEVIRDIREFIETGDSDELGPGTFGGDSLPPALAKDGGPGSGNFGHSGRPGKVGGSGPGGGSQYRVQSTKGKYEGIQKSKAFKSIARQARSAKDVRSFAFGLSKEQYDQFIKQYQSLGTKEDIWLYTERVYNLMRKQKPDKVPKNKTVEGKDISASYSGFRPEYEKYNDPVTGQLVDEEIENVMSKQGFLGYPKVVSQEEFDKIIKDHPEMPILYRSYTGATPEQAQDFDEMLEKGEWYVDCAKGGAGHGYGMYCAGVYQKEPLYRWDDPNISEDDLERYCVFTDKLGKGYTSKEKVQADEAGELYVDTPYLIINKDGTRSLLRMDRDSLMWEDVNTGAVYGDKEADDIVWNAKSIYECKDQDLGVYADAYTKERERGIQGALEEMEHYRALGIRRIETEAKPEAPDGMGRAASGVGEDLTYYWYDPSKATSFTDSLPKEGDVIVIQSKVNEDFNKLDKKPFKVEMGTMDGKRGLLLVPLEKLDYLSTAFLDDYASDPDMAWAKIEGECEEPKIDPTPVTRVMTLDPSAKIITSREIKNYKAKGQEIRDRFKEQQARELNDYLSNLSFDDAWCESNLYYLMMGEGMGNKTDAQVKKIADYKKSHPERMEKLEEYVKKQTDAKIAMKQEAQKYDNISYLDDGIVAALLGYDAINAEGHGQSDSYTIVLNRTKLILSEQRVDMRDKKG